MMVALKMAGAASLGAAGVLAMQVQDDPNVQLLELELLKTFPSVKQAMEQAQSMIGQNVGPEIVLAALFIVCCGRAFITMIDKAWDDYRDERRERRLERRAQWDRNWRDHDRHDRDRDRDDRDRGRGDGRDGGRDHGDRGRSDRDRPERASAETPPKEPVPLKSKRA
jgi:hypothetical protein